MQSFGRIGNFTILVRFCKSRTAEDLPEPVKKISQQKVEKRSKRNKSQQKKSMLDILTYAFEFKYAIIVSIGLFYFFLSLGKKYYIKSKPYSRFISSEARISNLDARGRPIISYTAKGQFYSIKLSRKSTEFYSGKSLTIRFFESNPEYLWIYISRMDSIFSTSNKEY